MEDILKRLGNVESDVSDLKSKVSTVLETLPHLATKSDVAEVLTEMSTRLGELRTDMATRETAFIKWMIATVLTVAGVAFTIAKFVH